MKYIFAAKQIKIWKYIQKFPFSSETVKGMSLDRRNCISRNESMANLPTQYHPQYYKFYTKEGCIIECRAKYSMSQCGCLPYYYPQFEKDSYCNSTGLKCLAKISGIFINVYIVSRFNLFVLFKPRWSQYFSYILSIILCPIHWRRP